MLFRLDRLRVLALEPPTSNSATNIHFNLNYNTQLSIRSNICSPCDDNDNNTQCLQLIGYSPESLRRFIRSLCVTSEAGLLLSNLFQALRLLILKVNKLEYLNNDFINIEVFLLLRLTFELWTEVQRHRDSLRR